VRVTKAGTKAFVWFHRMAGKPYWETLGRARMESWTLHDLRRTARSLMSRAKVPTDHAERAMGHLMGGVRETYDRYEYLDESERRSKRWRYLLGRSLINNRISSSFQLTAPPRCAHERRSISVNYGRHPRTT
jgi:integrase